MDQDNGTICKLCLKSIIDRKSQVHVQEVTLVLSVLSLNVFLNLDEKDSYMCNDCSVKLHTAYEFKVMCLDTEYSLTPYVDSEKASQVDLRDIYLKVKETTVTSHQQVCRLCMSIVDSGFMPLDELSDANMVNKYIPEVNFSITKDPVLCKHCWNSLGTHINFLRKWLNIEKEIKIEPKDLDNVCIKSEESDIKFEEHNEYGDLSLGELYDEILNGNSTSTNTHTSHSRSSYKDPSETKNYKCDKCDYQTNHKGTLVRHQLQHRDPSEAKNHKCDKCHYQTNRKSSLVRHQLLHRDPSETKEFKCEKCDYQTNDKNRLTKHQVHHREASEVQMYKCEICDHQTNRKDSLLKHLLRHRDPSESKKYKCGKCDYQTNLKSSVIIHQSHHEESVKVKLYKCSKCDYESSWKSNVNKHQLRHRDPSEVKMYKCDVCDFETKRKDSLLRHQIQHRDPSNVQT